MNSDFVDAFISKNKLPPDYRTIALEWFKPLAKSLSAYHNQAGQQILVAINGCQGSGKSTLAAILQLFLHHLFGKTCLAFSLDDFYLTADERLKLATHTHPLLATRGVPGTHNIPLLLNTLHSLKTRQKIQIPKFSKSIDDRLPLKDWQSIDEYIDIIIIEGWCMGATAQTNSDLVKPINKLEKEQDSDGRWRRYINQQLKDNYSTLFHEMDVWIMLQAPSFDCVYQWRLEQERKLAQTLMSGADHSGVMSDEKVLQFIQYYQRITQNTLVNLPPQVHFLFELDKGREIQKCTQPKRLL